MRRRHSLRFRLAAVFAVTFAIGGGALTAAGYAIVAHTFPRPLQADQLIGIPAATSAASADTKSASTTDSGAAKAKGTSAAAPDDTKSRPATDSAAAPADTKRTPATGSGAGARRADAAGLAAAVPVSAVPTVQTAQARQRETGLRQALLLSIAALVAVIGVAVVAGWQVAGRALAPIRKITATAHEISADRLDDRIALAGPDDELRELAETFDGMLDRLEGSFVAQSRFVASASHELQTPLTLVRAEVDVVLEDPDASRSELREALAQVRASAERGGDVVDALLVLARSGSALETTDDVDLTATVDAAIAAVGPRADAAGIAVVAAPAAPRPVIVRGDRALLTALVDNLLANAVIYNRDGGEVTVTTTADGDTGAATLRVRNTGPAIPTVDVDGLFAPFARGETSRARRTGGAGLGLAIVRTVAEAHDGTATATAGPDGGLDVCVRLRQA